jgi:hypothetical protein
MPAHELTAPRPMPTPVSASGHAGGVPPCPSSAAVNCGLALITFKSELTILAKSQKVPKSPCRHRVPGPSWPTALVRSRIPYVCAAHRTSGDTMGARGLAGDMQIRTLVRRDSRILTIFRTLPYASRPPYESACRLALRSSPSRAARSNLRAIVRNAGANQRDRACGCGAAMAASFWAPFIIFLVVLELIVIISSGNKANQTHHGRPDRHPAPSTPRRTRLQAACEGAGCSYVSYAP